jgi:hypothetical protein
MRIDCGRGYNKGKKKELGEWTLDNRIDEYLLTTSRIKARATRFPGC